MLSAYSCACSGVMSLPVSRFHSFWNSMMSCVLRSMHAVKADFFGIKTVCFRYYLSVFFRYFFCMMFRMKKKSYTIKRELSEDQVLVCGGLNFNPNTNQIWSNKGKGAIFIRKDSHSRRLLWALMMSQKLLTYDELISALFSESKKIRPPSCATKEKFVNDKIDALKKKLMKLEFTREVLREMFRCDEGYQLVRPKVGRKIGSSKRFLR